MLKRTDSLTPNMAEQSVNYSSAKLLRETIFGSYRLCHFGALICLFGSLNVISMKVILSSKRMNQFTKKISKLRSKLKKASNSTNVLGEKPIFLLNFDVKFHKKQN